MFDQDFAVLSELERSTVRRVSGAGRVLADEMTRLVSPVVLDGLTALGFLRRVENVYAIGNEFLARWLREAQPWDRPSTVTDASTVAVYEQAHLQPVLEAVQQNQIALAEMERILDAIRRVGCLAARGIACGCSDSDDISQDRDCCHGRGWPATQARSHIAIVASASTLSGVQS
jgi:hypothetical protein